jgi:hypothetical protein
MEHVDWKKQAIEFCNAVIDGNYDFICQSKASFTLAKIDNYDVKDLQDYQIITTFITKVGF